MRHKNLPTHTHISLVSARSSGRDKREVSTYSDERGDSTVREEVEVFSSLRRRGRVEDTDHCILNISAVDIAHSHFHTH